MGVCYPSKLASYFPRTMSFIDGKDEVHWVYPPSSLVGLKTIPLSGMNQIFLSVRHVR